MSHVLPFDLVELAPCPASYAAGPGAPLREAAFRGDAWLPEELDALRTAFDADEDLQMIADTLGRTLPAVRTRVADLGLRRNSSRPWPEMEDGYLTQHYGVEATSAIAAMLGRSCAALYARAGYLGLTEGNAPPYTAWEIAQVRAGYAQGIPVAQLCVLIGRPASGMASMASKLGIRHANSPPDWSGAEQGRALELAETGIRYAAIADRLEAEGFPRREGRTVGQTLRRLGYGRGWGRPWLEEESDLLRHAYTHGKSLTPLQDRLGRTRESIAYRAGELGLQGTHARPNGWRTEPSWTEDDKAILRRDYGVVPTPELARRFGRAKAGVYNMAWSMGLVHGFMRAFTADEDRAIRNGRDHGVSLTDVSAALGRDTAVVSKHAIRMGIPFGARTIKAPRGPRSGRPAVTLQQLLDPDRTPAEQEAVTPPPAQAERPSDPFGLILATPEVPAVPMGMLRAMQAAGLLHVAAQAGPVVVLTSHPAR